MKPNGLVAAARITSHTSMFILLHMSAISLTSPMFTLRNVFSRSFTVSATRAFETGTTVVSEDEYNATAISVQAGVTPPTTFGVFLVLKRGLRGSTRLGGNAR